MYTKINKIRYIEQESYKGSIEWVIVGVFNPNLRQEHILFTWDIFQSNLWYKNEI